MNHSLPPRPRPALAARRTGHGSGLPTAPLSLNVGDEVSVGGVLYRVVATLVPEGGGGNVNPPPPPPPPPPAPTIGGLFLGDRVTRGTVGAPGVKLVLLGRGFGATAGSVTFGLAVAPVALWSDTEIDLAVPAAVSGSYPVTLHINGGGNYNVGAAFAITMPPAGLGGPAISGLVDAAGQLVQQAVPEEQIVVTGTGFGATAGRVNYAGLDLPVVSWSDSRIVVTLGVPPVMPAALTVTDTLGRWMMTRAFAVLPP